MTRKAAESFVLRWADDSDELLIVVHRLAQAGISIPSARLLDDAVGRMQAMLQVGAEDMDEAGEQVRWGEVFTMEEVRSEQIHRIRRTFDHPR